MDQLPEHIVFDLLSLVSQPSLINLAVVCRRLCGLIYAKHNGPPYNLSAYTFHTQHENPLHFRDADALEASLEKTAHLRAYVLERILARDRDFVLRCIRKHPDFMRSLTHPLRIRTFSSYTGGAPHRICTFGPGLLEELASSDDLEFFALIVDHLQMPAFGFERKLGLSEPRDRPLPPAYEHLLSQNNGLVPYPYFRLLVQHNLRHGYHLERSGCTACRQRPYMHREWTMQRLLENDDVELLKAYLALRFPTAHAYTNHNWVEWIPTEPGAYRLNQRTMLRMYEHCAEGIASFWQETGRTARFTAAVVGPWTARVSTETLHFALRHGLDLSGIPLLRRALRSNPELALALLETYAYRLVPQDRRHMLRHARRWEIGDQLVHLINQK